jgi:hypothetical protein
VLTLVENYINIDWVKPFNGGVLINGYRVEVRTVLGIFTQELNNCNGSLELIVDATECNVYFEDLMASPFELNLGAVVEVRLLAYNYYGDSTYSDMAYNQDIVWMPDAVQILQNAVDITSAFVIGLTW